MIKAEDIPQDVQWVWAIQAAGRPVGLDMLSKIHAIIREHPTYFPWETKYDSIPKEVHDAYWSEKSAWMDEMWQSKRDSGYQGLIPTIMQMDEIAHEPPATPQVSLSEMLDNLLKRQEDEYKRQKEENAKNKTLWDKHYGPYKLEYRK